jgi:hypothetical protein
MDGALTPTDRPPPLFFAETTPLKAGMYPSDEVQAFALKVREVAGEFRGVALTPASKAEVQATVCDLALKYEAAAPSIFKGASCRVFQRDNDRGMLTLAFSPPVLDAAVYWALKAYDQAQQLADIERMAAAWREAATP